MPVVCNGPALTQRHLPLVTISDSGSDHPSAATPPLHPLPRCVSACATRARRWAAAARSCRRCRRRRARGCRRRTSGGAPSWGTCPSPRARVSWRLGWRTALAMVCVETCCRNRPASSMWHSFGEPLGCTGCSACDPAAPCHRLTRRTCRLGRAGVRAGVRGAGAVPLLLPRAGNRRRGLGSLLGLPRALLRRCCQVGRVRSQGAKLALKLNWRCPVHPKLTVRALSSFTSSYPVACSHLGCEASPAPGLPTSSG